MIKLLSDLGRIEEENWYESKIQAALLDEFILHLAKLYSKWKHILEVLFSDVSFEKKTKAIRLSPWCECI